MTPETRAVLLAAAELIEREGWARGSYRNDQGYCVAGAINEVSARCWCRDLGQARDVFDRHVVVRTTARNAFHWNDEICPDAATAVRELRACAGVAE